MYLFVDLRWLIGKCAECCFCFIHNIIIIPGLMPYNLMCVQAGSLLSEIQSTSDILTPAVAAKMALLAIAALLPALLKKVRNNHKGTKTMEASVLGDHCEIKDHMEWGTPYIAPDEQHRDYYIYSARQCLQTSTMKNYAQIIETRIIYI